MARQAGINALLYKIDINAVREYFSAEIEVQGIPARLVKEYNERKKEEIFESKGETNVSGSYIEAFLNIKSAPTTSSWVRFFKNTPIDFGQLSNQFQHLICFVALADELYAFTAGQSAVVFERFVDLSFPIEVGRRIAKPEIKSAHANQITGSTLASDLHFRDPRRITYTESLDTVWTALSGYLRNNKLNLTQVTDILALKTRSESMYLAHSAWVPRFKTPKKWLILLSGWQSKSKRICLKMMGGQLSTQLNYLTHEKRIS